MNNDNGTKKSSTKSKTSSLKRGSVASSTDFPLNAFAIQSEDSIRNPNLFNELYSMAYASAGEFELFIILS